MLDNFLVYLRRASDWVAAHWRMVMAMLCFVILLQQCTINRLQWEVERLARPQYVLARPDTLAPRAADTARVAANAADSVVAGVDTLAVATGGHAGAAADEGGGRPWVWLLVAAAIGALAFATVHMWREALFPVGLGYRVRLSRTPQGQLFFALRVTNRSRRVVELGGAQVNFIMGPAQTRRFRANVDSLPISLQPKTSYEAQINLTGLIAANLELAKAKAISLSIVANGRGLTSLPRPVKIKVA